MLAQVVVMGGARDCGPGHGIYRPMFAALGSLPHLQLLSVVMEKPSATANSAALPGLDSLNALRAPHLTTLDVDVQLKVLQVDPLVEHQSDSCSMLPLARGLPCTSAAQKTAVLQDCAHWTHLLAQGCDVRGTTLHLDGMPALRRCRISFRVAGRAGQPGMASIGASGFGLQRENLRELTLHGVGTHILLKRPFSFIDDLPALRPLVIQNLGLTDLRWLNPDGAGLVLGAVRSLDLDGNKALQLDDGSVAALLHMPALRKLSMRKRLPAEGDASTGTAGNEAKAAPRKAAWPPDSVHCIAQLVAGRPDLQLCF